jgi:hypothetical protein
MVMSDTRPPITAGPIDRAFRFLKSASLSDIGEGEGVAVADGGVSCADKIEVAEIETNKAQQRIIRVLMTAIIASNGCRASASVTGTGEASAPTFAARFAIRRTVVTL